MSGRITLRPDGDYVDARYRVSSKDGIQKNEDPGAVQSYEVRKKIKQNRESIKKSNTRIWISFALAVLACALVIAFWTHLTTLET